MTTEGTTMEVTQEGLNMTEEQNTAPTYDRSIHHNPDAQAWARFYCETVPDADEALMTGWFANAMMAMHDWQAQNHETACLALTTAQTEAAAMVARVAELEGALLAAANALAWAERRMACPAYAEVIANDERNARAALGSQP